MKDLLNAIESCLTGQEFYGALALSLVIPSIAAAASSVDNRDSEAGYADWFNTNIQSPTPHFNGQECYRLRCKLLHQGISAPDRRRTGYQSSFTSFVFTLPGQHLIAVNGNRSSSSTYDVLDISLEQFCRAIVSGGRTWLESVRGDSTIQSRLDTTVQRRPYNVPGISIKGSTDVEVIS